MAAVPALDVAVPVAVDTALPLLAKVQDLQGEACLRVVLQGNKPL
jgi:hypothetical protein